MKLKEYIEKLQEFVKEHPEALEFETVNAVDDEGNGYNVVGYGPSLGHYDGEYNGEFQCAKDLQENADYFCEDEESIQQYIDDHKANAVCIN